jgi:hypothetical protein
LSSLLGIDGWSIVLAVSVGVVVASWWIARQERRRARELAAAGRPG